MQEQGRGDQQELGREMATSRERSTRPAREREALGPWRWGVLEQSLNSSPSL